MYGSVNDATLKLYWHTDSIAKQAIMLADKAGLRPRGHSKKVVKPNSQYSDNDIAEMNRKLSKKLANQRKERQAAKSDSDKAADIRIKIEQRKNGK